MEDALDLEISQEKETAKNFRSIEWSQHFSEK